MSDQVVVIEDADVVLIERQADVAVFVEQPIESFITMGDAAMPGSRRPVVADLTYAATLAIDWTGVDEARVTLTGDFAPTLSGAADGQRCVLTLKQDGTGSRLVTLPANVRMGTDITGYTASTAAAKTDKLGFIYNATDSKFDLVALAKGY